MTNFSLNAQTRKAIEGLLLLAGSVLTVFNLFSFTVSKAGGYFFRPADAVNGGPEAAAISESVWLLREVVHGTEKTVAACTSSPDSPPTS